jgi:hypothetical protein
MLEAVASMDQVQLAPEQVNRLRQGQAVPTALVDGGDQLKEGIEIAVLSDRRELLAVGVIAGREIKPRTVFQL